MNTVITGQVRAFLGYDNELVLYLILDDTVTHGLVSQHPILLFGNGLVVHWNRATIEQDWVIDPKRGPLW